LNPTRLSTEHEQSYHLCTGSKAIAPKGHLIFMIFTPPYTMQVHSAVPYTYKHKWSVCRFSLVA